jgi:DNA-binding SARP family transcriptional activator
VLIHLLGPVRIHNGHEVELQPRLRTVLAALALHPNEPVNMAHLYEWLWDDGGYPSHPAAALYTYVCRLRSALGPLEALIATGLDSYRLDADADEIDALRFERLVAAGTAHRTMDEGQLREALELWQGPPLCDIPPTEPACAVRFRLGELRLHAIEARNEALLQQGLAHQLIGDLMKLSAEFPCHEQFACQLMTCLALLGRRIEALGVYQRIYRRLGDDLGIRPGPELAALHVKLLRGEQIGLAGKVILQARPGTGNSGAAFAANQDPGCVSNRDDGVTSPWRACLVERIDEALAESGPGMPSIAVLTGPPGSGATSVALRYAQANHGRYDGSVSFIDLARRAHAGDRDDLPVTAPAWQTAENSRLRPRPAGDSAMLTILDGAGSTRQVLAAIVSCSGHIVVTSSRRLPGLYGAREVRLHAPSAPQAAIIFRRMLGRDTDEEHGLYATIAELCECNLLALAAVAANLSNHVYPSVAAAVEALMVSPAERVAELATGEISVVGSFERALGSCSTEEQLLAQEMAARPPGWVSYPELAETSRSPDHIVRSAVHGLVEANLAQAATDAEGTTRYRLSTLCAGTIEFLERLGNVQSSYQTQNINVQRR